MLAARASAVGGSTAKTQPLDSPIPAGEHRPVDRRRGGDSDHVAVLRIGHGVELLVGEVQESHHEAPDREAVTHDQDVLVPLSIHLTHHALEERRDTVVAVRRTLASSIAVEEPAVKLSERFLLRLDRVPVAFEAVLHFSEPRIFEDSDLPRVQARAFDEAIERLARAGVRRSEDEGILDVLGPNFTAALSSLFLAFIGQRNQMVSEVLRGEVVFVAGLQVRSRFAVSDEFDFHSRVSPLFSLFRRIP